MFDRTLMERLEAMDRGEAPSGPVLSEGLLFDSILANVRRILNDRAACCSTRPDYGMPDLNDILGQGADSVIALARAVRLQIETFEPRLKSVQVTFRPDPDAIAALPFQVTGVVVLPDGDSRVAFQSVLTADKMIEVHG
ncbi:MAG: type VI secretion system baseplate subunit TssE [Phreatobacter sp.]|uniref:type VI secretion system baseplate subunit TssE n=1 Tax=Phreatobacter sp. TaxID=1966341 RepID=UPI0027326B8E|nr:type VI secretion system baseplate subunit TssE [Phreatobacter sp.]MDP2800826.1 type VI secretion system baseplate subunit TssE [Phreatobacter sp.]